MGNPNGFCLCGCGQLTNLAPQTHRGKGWVKGEPLNYLYGHFSPAGGKTRPLFGEDHPRWNGGKASYRRRALREKGAACEECGYDEHSELLWVHHENLKPSATQDDHSIENLEVLCIRCHLEKHIETGTGRYSDERRQSLSRWARGQEVG